MKKNERLKRTAVRPLTLEEKIADQLKSLSTMSLAERRQSLLRAGIITPEGKLAPPYR